MKLTPWFPDHTVPTRPGYYETRRPNLYGQARIARRTAVGGVRREKPGTITITLYWNGRAWMASKHSDNSSLFIQRREWRGVFRM